MPFDFIAAAKAISPSLVSALRPSPFEIIFNAGNPSRRFWSVGNFSENGKTFPYWEYRIEIKNRRWVKTVKNVSVAVEHIGPMPQRPRDHFFDKTKTTSCDLKPGCAELVSLVQWPIPIRQVGLLSGASALAYGPIQVTVSGDDVKPMTKIFEFDYQCEPMIRELKRERRWRKWAGDDNSTEAISCGAG